MLQCASIHACVFNRTAEYFRGKMPSGAMKGPVTGAFGPLVACHPAAFWRSCTRLYAKAPVGGDRLPVSHYHKPLL